MSLYDIDMPESLHEWMRLNVINDEYEQRYVEENEPGAHFTAEQNKVLEAMYERVGTAWEEAPLRDRVKAELLILKQVIKETWAERNRRKAAR